MKCNLHEDEEISSAVFFFFEEVLTPLVYPVDPETNLQELLFTKSFCKVELYHVWRAADQRLLIKNALHCTTRHLLDYLTDVCVIV